MKRLLSAILFASALATLGFGITKLDVVITQTSQDQKAEKNYDIYVGKYQVGQEFILTITNENGKLMGQPTGDEKAEFKAQAAPDEFYSDTVEARLKFAKDGTGAVVAVVVTIFGKDYYSKKIK